MSEYATRDALLKRHVRRYRDCQLPDGAIVRLQSITERERSEWESHIKIRRGQVTRESMQMMRARLIVLCLVDDAGQQILQPGDAAQILDWDSALSNALFEQCQEHCGISEADVEGLAKNCETTPTGGSPSG